MSDTAATAPHPELVAGLMQPRAFARPCGTIELVETHISWVILTGELAYKIKKPVDMGFLDFRTLEARSHFCHEEVRLNRRWAPDLYLGVEPIGGTPGRPVVGADVAPGEAIEYAVKMKQFPAEARLDRAIAADRIEPGHLDRLAERFAELHQRAPVSGPGEGFATARGLAGRIDECLDHLERHRSGDHPTPRTATLRQWLEREIEDHTPLIEHRRAAGMVRDCHGDAHLENLVLLGDEIVPFDGIEFDESLRRIDVLNDAAYTAMDLHAHDRRAFAARFINRYLERTGDYLGVPLLRLFEAYRALVRAMVEAMRGDESAGWAGYERYARFLETRCATPPAPLLVMTHGPSGSGKTTLTQVVLEQLPAIRLRTDIERKRLFGLPMEEPTPRDRRGEVYSQAASERVYGRLHELAGTMLRAGVSVVLDGTYLDRGRRDAARRVARESGASAVVVDLQTPPQVLRERIAARRDDASEADLEVLESQLARGPGLDEDEKAASLSLDTLLPRAAERLLAALRERRDPRGNRKSAGGTCGTD